MLDSRIKVDKMKRHLFHITECDWGDIVTLRPKANGEYRDPNEPEIPRICLSDNISGCIVAVYPCLSSTNVRVYRTVRRIKAHIPYDVYDQHITKEKWSLRNIQMMLVGMIDTSVLPLELEHISPGSEDGLTLQKSVYRQIRKLELDGKLIKRI